MAETSLSKAALEADTDTALQFFRDARPEIGGSPGGAFFTKLGSGLAEQMSAEFPGVHCGRVLMAAARSLKELRRELARTGVDADADTLLSVLAIAAEQLDRERRDA